MQKSLPTRKEMNVQQFEDLIPELNEFIGENATFNSLIWGMFDDLSATKQEKYITIVKNELKNLKGDQ